jgi:phage-related protein
MISILLTKEADEFVNKQPEKVRAKIYQNIKLVEAGVKKPELFKKLNDDIWELRTKYESKEYRLLSFWDTEKETLIIATNGFLKKTKKTPRKEIEKAEKIREEYFTT